MEFEDVGFVVFFTLFFSWWFGSVYLMWVHPARWVEWFLIKPWKRFGITVSIGDAARLKRNLRRLGVLYTVVGVTVLLVLVLTIPGLSQ